MRTHFALVALAAGAMSFGQIMNVTAIALEKKVSIQSGGSVYDNRVSPYFTSGVRPPRALDDAVLTAGSTNFTCIEFGMNLSAADAALSVSVGFFETVNYGAAVGTLNTGFLGAFLVSFSPIGAGGSYTSGLIDFTGVIPGGITVADGNLGVDLIFFNAAGALSTTTTVLFAGGGPTVGSSVDAYARDVNGNGQYDPGEARFFNGPPNLANFYMRLTPEPSTYAAMATGLFGILGLRRRRK
jgi:hypothetical protein